jgi:hypothetical protein
MADLPVSTPNCPHPECSLLAALLAFFAGDGSDGWEPPASVRNVIRLLDSPHGDPAARAAIREATEHALAEIEAEMAAQERAS